MKVTPVVKPIRPLKELSCLVAAGAGKLTDDVLTQPDYRELMHRILPKHEQIKLLNESHEYATNGRLYIRALYDSSGFKHTQWWWYNSNVLCYTSFSKSDTRLEITFLTNGTIADIEFVNPHGVGAELSVCRYYTELEPYLNGNPHGISCHKTCLSTHLNIKNSSCERKCNCDGRFIDYFLYEQGGYITKLTMDLELD